MIVNRRETTWNHQRKHWFSEYAKLNGGTQNYSSSFWLPVLTSPSLDWVKGKPSVETIFLTIKYRDFMISCHTGFSIKVGDWNRHASFMAVMGPSVSSTWAQHRREKKSWSLSKTHCVMRLFSLHMGNWIHSESIFRKLFPFFQPDLGNLQEIWGQHLSPVGPRFQISVYV